MSLENAEILAIQFVPAFAKRCIFSMGIDLRSTTKRSNHYSPLLGGSFRVRVSNFELGKLMRLHVVAIAKSGHVIDFIHSGKQSSVEVCSACRRSEEHMSELQSPLNISYAVFCLKKKKKKDNNKHKKRKEKKESKNNKNKKK